MQMISLSKIFKVVSDVTFFSAATSSPVETTPLIKVIRDQSHDDNVFLHNFEHNSNYAAAKDPGAKH
jgi:hypothetical protein